jgi:hypothetical protein
MATIERHHRLEMDMQTKRKEAVIRTQEGESRRVEQFAAFERVIDGQRFKFLVTRELDGVHKVVTHAKSGNKVCMLGVGAAYLPAFSRLSSDKERAELALDELIERVGADRVRCVIAAAEA